MTEEERARILEAVGNIYAAGYAEGTQLVADEYALHDLVVDASMKMPKAMEIRLDMVEQSMARYVESIQRKLTELRRKDLPEEQVSAELTSYARNLTSVHADVIAQTEYAKGRMDGAKAIMDESGEEYEFRFPHFDLMTPGHEVCAICEAIAENSPYSSEEAEAAGYPDIPHPNCDHGWVLVPKGEMSRTEEFPQGPATV